MRRTQSFAWVLPSVTALVVLESTQKGGMTIGHELGLLIVFVLLLVLRDAFLSTASRNGDEHSQSAGTGKRTG
ncbi:hypothetical protein HY375_02800 [Candidatus Berkelbacteria bacterium]|nr:hypothetical protein [Candidatus Berkelbacteria bacterium]